MQEYGDIDIALDPTPYNGGTTTLQALEMGLPVVSMTGSNLVSRMGASFLTALGRPEWLAADEDGYMAAAVRLADSCPALRGLRDSFRWQMQTSPLTDIQGHTRQLEALYENMWALRCAGDGLRLITL